LVSYYEILEIDRSASEEDIKRAYRRLVLKWHPDKNPGDPKAAAIFLMIQEAYDTLSDYIRRREHDDRLDGRYQEPVRTAPADHTPPPPPPPPPRRMKLGKKVLPKGTVPSLFVLLGLIVFVLYLYLYKADEEYIKAPIEQPRAAVIRPQVSDTVSRTLDSQFRAAFLSAGDTGENEAAADTLTIRDSSTLNTVEQVPETMW